MFQLLSDEGSTEVLKIIAVTTGYGQFGAEAIKLKLSSFAYVVELLHSHGKRFVWAGSHRMSQSEVLVIYVHLFLAGLMMPRAQLNVVSEGRTIV